ncbi:hypothetical protein V496_09537 [Pseudogymnoascus sp. VKM F-4515 (FW-2607)]|nr:hypothetical protein V496_09537 [Pseudogymnoascus sp. VKM F-4515 (FW-2607)]
MQSTSDNNNWPPRKRARIACHLCHARKVRCDAALVGIPCTNCRLDRHVCTVRNSSARRPKKRIQALEVILPPSPSTALTASAPIGAEDPTEMRPLETFVENDDNMFLSASSKSNHISNSPYGLYPQAEDHMSPYPFRPSSIPPNMEDFSPFSRELVFNTSVTFSYYRFLEVKELAKLSPSDVRYLESKGCLHVPSGTHLDQFIQHYFLHVHPCTPLLDEGQFWGMYSNTQDDSKGTNRISLLLFQAILFSAATFVPLSTIRACGFHNYYTAREVLYERARLLYNFRTETDFASIAQASLLLSYRSTPHEQQSNTSWLSTAIEYARADNAHLYNRLPGLTSRQMSTKKRLWWCCVLRDRIIALGVRRPLQITSDHFDFSQDAVVEADFSGEVEQSQVYDAETKLLLANIFIVQCHFALAVTSTIMAIYPLNGVVIPVLPTPARISELHIQMEEGKNDLKKWMEIFKDRLTRGSSKSAALHNSVTLFTDVTNIYYYTAQIARCQHSMYFLTECQPLTTEVSHQLETTQFELERAIIDITSRVTNLVTLCLVGYLPISVVAYTALPLALLSLDVRFSSTEPEKASRQQRLSVFLETMKQCGHRFDFVGVVSAIITKVLRLVDFGKRSDFPSNNTSSSSDANLTVSRTPNACPKSWTEFVNTQPNLYLRLSAFLDFALSKGKFPSEDELPEWITNPSKPHMITRSMEFPSLVNSASAVDPRDSVIRERPFSLSQQFCPDNSIFIFSGSSSQGYDAFDGVTSGLWDSTETRFVFDELGGISEHTREDISESPFSSNILSELFDLPATGG